MRSKVLRLGLIFLAIGYMAFCTDFYVRQEQYLMKPDQDPAGMRASELKESEFVLPSNMLQGDKNAAVCCRRYQPKTVTSKGTVLYFHGNKGNMDKCEWEIEFLVELGYEVWTLDYRGFGTSKGPVSEEALRADAAAAYQLVTAESLPENVIVWGRSFGSGIAASVVAGAKKEPKLLVLETPYWSLMDAARRNGALVPSTLFRYELPTHQYLLSVTCPIHLIHGTQDEKIPFHSSERLLELAKKHRLNVKAHAVVGGLHNLREDTTIFEFEEITHRILD